jgi:hypothetical protein
VSSLQLETDLTGWFTEGTFIISVVLALVYIPSFEWRETGTGKAFTILILAIAGALFRPVLIIWGVISFRQGTKQLGFWDDLFIWLSIISLGAAGIAIATLTFKTLQVLFTESGNKWICRLLFIERKPPRGPDGKTR